MEVHTRRGQDPQGEDPHVQYLPRQQQGVRRARLPQERPRLADGEATQLDAHAILSTFLQCLVSGVSKKHVMATTNHGMAE